jgi:hypothetical protein
LGGGRDPENIWLFMTLPLSPLSNHFISFDSSRRLVRVHMWVCNAKYMSRWASHRIEPDKRRTVH